MGKYIKEQRHVHTWMSIYLYANLLTSGWLSEQRRKGKIYTEEFKNKVLR
jgi:hypothetical protein